MGLTQSVKRRKTVYVSVFGTVGLYCPQDREANHARTHYGVGQCFSPCARARSQHFCPGDNMDPHKRHGQVAWNTLKAKKKGKKRRNTAPSEADAAAGGLTGA